MIASLTPAQESALAQYRDKWLKVGLDTRRADREKAQQDVVRAYKVAGLDAPKIFVWQNSPFEGAIAAALLSDSKFGVSAQVGAQVYDQVSAQVDAQVRAQVGAQVGAQVRAQVGAQVYAQVRAQVYDQVSAQVYAQVRAQVRAQVGAQVRAQVYDQVRVQTWRSFWASHEAGWLSYYNFFLEECGIKACERLQPLMDLAGNVGWTWFFNGAVVFTEKPVEIHRNAQFRLHNFDGPALHYADGFELYRFNGVTVPKEYADTKADAFTKEQILKETNADIRREIVRKIGIAKAIEILGAKTIDSENGYELLSIELGDNRTRPFLKMKNPSMLETWHVEGVRPECLTVRDAIKFRNQLESFSWPKTLDGAAIATNDVGTVEQQGDCLVFPVDEIPSDAKRLDHKIAADGLVRHVVENGDLFELSDRRFLAASGGCFIGHPEHKPMGLDVGFYEIKKVLEYDHFLEESREVID